MWFTKKIERAHEAPSAAAHILQKTHACRPAIPLNTHRQHIYCQIVAASLTFIYFCNIFFTLLYHLANQMRHAYAARPLCTPAHSHSLPAPERVTEHGLAGRCARTTHFDAPSL